MSRAAIFALAAPIALAACSTGVVIDSEPHGARVLVDGEVVGITPFTARLPITTFGTYSFVAELPGYRTAEGELPQETNPEAIALSIFFPPGFLFSVHRAADHVMIGLEPEVPFPAGFAYELPYGPPLPPLPPGMAAGGGPGTGSAPATLPSEKRSP